MGIRDGGRRVGELAAAAGLTVRTLHYYEQIGLLVPSARTASGHRLYDSTDVDRLYRIVVLRRLGLPLDDIKRALDDQEWDLRRVLTAHVAGLDDRLAAGSRLRARLAALLSAPAGPERDMFELLKETTMLETTPQRRVSVLVYRDVHAAHDYLVDVFGLGPGALSRDQEGRVVHAELQAGDGVVWLHPEADRFGLASPATAGSATAMVAVMVDDVDAHHRHACSRGAQIEYGPTDQPYGYREYAARDLEGHLWSFMRPLP